MGISTAPVAYDMTVRTPKSAATAVAMREIPSCGRATSCAGVCDCCNVTHTDDEVSDFLAGVMLAERLIGTSHTPLFSSLCEVRYALAPSEGRVSAHEEFRTVSVSASPAPRSMWSPFYRALTLVVMFGMVFGGLVLAQPQHASAQSAAVTTDYLNLRAEPNTDAGIISVMPPGASITVTGGGQNGFLPVTHGGNSGWAHGDWISVGGSAPSAPAPGPTGTAYVIDGALNLRSGPSTGNSVITVMPDGAQVSLSGQSSGGFLSVVYNGTSGWAHGDYLRTGGSAPAPAPSQPAPSNPGVGDTVIGTMVTTDSLNMRSGPSTSNGIITTIPRGVTVELMGS